MSAGIYGIPFDGSDVDQVSQPHIVQDKGGLPVQKQKILREQTLDLLCRQIAEILTRSRRPFYR